MAASYASPLVYTAKGKTQAMVVDAGFADADFLRNVVIAKVAVSLGQDQVLSDIDDLVSGALFSAAMGEDPMAARYRPAAGVSTVPRIEIITGRDEEHLGCVVFQCQRVSEPKYIPGRLLMLDLTESSAWHINKY